MTDAGKGEKKRRVESKGALESAVDKVEDIVKRNEKDEKLHKLVMRVPDDVWAQVLVIAPLVESKRLKETATFLHNIKLIPAQRLVLDSRVWCTRRDVNVPQLLIDERKSTLKHLHFNYTIDCINDLDVFECKRLTSLVINHRTRLDIRPTVHQLVAQTNNRLQRFVLRSGATAAIPTPTELLVMLKDAPLTSLAYSLHGGLTVGPSLYALVGAFTNLRELELGILTNVNREQWDEVCRLVCLNRKLRILRFRLARTVAQITLDSLRPLATELRELKFWAETKDVANDWSILAAFQNLTVLHLYVPAVQSKDLLPALEKLTQLTTLELGGYSNGLFARDVLVWLHGRLPNLERLNVLNTNDYPDAATWATFVADHLHLVGALLPHSHSLSLFV
jgi:hypothetical protein